MRIGCLLAPELPWAARCRAEPELEGRPGVVVSEAGPRATVVSLSPEASRAGIHPGSSLAQARAVCAGLRVRVAAPALERGARQALRDAALSVSPRVEEGPLLSGAYASEASVFLDASGVRTVFGSEAGMVTALVARAQGLGLPAVAAVASSRVTARLIARCLVREQGAGAVRVVPEGQEAAFLAPLPLDLLDLEASLAQTLTRFGLHRLGELLALPRRTLATRLSPEARQWAARLRGEEPEPPLAVPGEVRCVESCDLEAPIDALEPLAFVLQGLLGRLIERLAVRNLACGTLALTLGLSGGGRETRHLSLAAPTQDPRVLLRRLRLALETAPPRDAVESLALATAGVAARSDQLDFFRPAGPAPAALEALVAELEALCGPGRVGAPATSDTHRPDAFALHSFDPRAAEVSPRAGEAAPPVPEPVLAMRALRPPVPAEVRLRAGRPAWLRSALARGDVVRCAGPWRTTGGWWSREDRFAFDHFDVLTSDGLLTRLRFDALRRCWELDGVYD